MKFTKLTIENFLSLEKAEIQLADRGLVLIQGINKDNTSAESNGSGKSSIPDALCWCLYGVTARGVGGDDVVNRAVGKDTLVKVDIQDGADSYTIERYRKRAPHKNALIVFKNNPDGSQTSLGLGTDKATQEVVDKLLGCSYEVFRSAVYSGQETMPDLPAMTDKQLKVLVEEAAGVHILEAAYAEARARRDTALGRLETAKSSWKMVETMYDAALATEKTYKENHGAFEMKRRLDIDEMEEDIVRLGIDICNLQDAVKAIDGKALNAKLREAEEAIANVDDEKKRERELDKTVNEAEYALLDIHSKITRWKSDVTKAKTVLAEADKLIGTPCSECGKIHEEADLAETKKGLSTKLKELSDQASDLKKSKDDASNRVEKARETLEAFRASMTDVSKTVADISSLKDKLKELALLETKLGNAMVTIDANMTKVKALKKAPNTFADLLAKQTETVETLEKDLGKIEAEIEEHERDLEIAESVVKVFSPSGVRALILDEVTPFLNDQTAKYLASLTDGNTTATWSTLVRNAKGELREKFSIEVSDTTGGESFAALSGGEKRKVRIATALALQDLVARRATKPIELFIGDEIDDALDEAGLERLTGILEERARERGSVFIISHNDIKDWAPSTITVVKSKGKSVVFDEEA